MVELGLGAMGLRRTMQMLEKLPQRSSERASALSTEDAERVVSRAFRAHIGLRGLCLERALVQWAVHRMEGTPARFVIGVRGKVTHPTESLQAHAWVQPADERDVGNDGYVELLGDEVT